MISETKLEELAISFMDVAREHPETILLREYRKPFVDYDPNATYPPLVDLQFVPHLDRYVEASTPQGLVLMELGFSRSELRRYTISDYTRRNPARISANAQKYCDTLMAERLGIPVAQAVLARVVGNREADGPHTNSGFADVLTHPQTLLGSSAGRLLTLGRIIDSMGPEHWRHLIWLAEKREEKLARQFPDPLARFYSRTQPGGGDRNLVHEAWVMAAHYSFAKALTEKPYGFEPGIKPHRLITMTAVVACDDITSRYAGVGGREAIGLSLFPSPDGNELTRATLRSLRTVSSRTLAARYEARGR